MARHLHAADEAALDEGIIVSSFSSLQLPSWRDLGVDLPNPVDSFFDDSPHKVVDPDVESVDSLEADADLQTVHDHAVKVILAETPVAEPAVAHASEGISRPQLKPASKAVPRPRPSMNPARVVVATTSSSSSAANAWTSSMVSDVIRSYGEVDPAQPAADDVDVSGSYQRFVDAFPTADPEQHASDVDYE